MLKAFIERPTYSAGFEGRVGEKRGLIPYTVPDEVWEVEHLKGEFFKPLKPIKVNWNDRRVPPCGYFPLCSQCQWMHIRPPKGLKYKIKLFEEYVGVKPDKVLVSPSEFHYRVKTFLYHRRGKLGFKKSWFFDPKQNLLEVDYCYLLHPLLNDAIATLREVRFPENLHAVELFVNPQSGEMFAKFLFLRNSEIPPSVLGEIESLPFEGKGIYKGEYLHWERVKVLGRWETALTINGFKYRLSPDCFLQPNHLLWGEFQRLVKPLGEYKKGLELHAGIGFFTLPLAGYVERLESSDLSGESSKYRNLNLELNGITNVESFKLDYYKHLRVAKDFDLLVVDPPRGGLGPKAVSLIMKKQPQEIIYISCNLESLKRDLTLLKEGYKVAKTALVEQFPNTYHIESVVWLKKTP